MTAKSSFWQTGHLRNSNPDRAAAGTYDCYQFAAAVSGTGTPAAAAAEYRRTIQPYFNRMWRLYERGPEQQHVKPGQVTLMVRHSFCFFGWNRMAGLAGECWKVMVRSDRDTASIERLPDPFPSRFQDAKNLYVLGAGESDFSGNTGKKIARSRFPLAPLHQIFARIGREEPSSVGPPYYVLAINLRTGRFVRTVTGASAAGKTSVYGEPAQGKLNPYHARGERRTSETLMRHHGNNPEPAFSALPPELPQLSCVNGVRGRVRRPNAAQRATRLAPQTSLNLVGSGRSARP